MDGSNPVGKMAGHLPGRAYHPLESGTTVAAGSEVFMK